MRIRPGGSAAGFLAATAVVLCMFRYAVKAEFVGEWELGLASPLGSNSRYEIFPTGTVQRNMTAGRKEVARKGERVTYIERRVDYEWCIVTG